MKLRSFWIITVVSIFALTFYGRQLQQFLTENSISVEWISSITKFILILLVLIAFLWLARITRSFRLSLPLLILIPVVFILPHIIPIIDERVHFITFGILGFLSLNLFGHKFGLLVCVFISAIDELFQWFLPSRVGELSDVLINLVACSIGAFIAHVGMKYSRRELNVKRRHTNFFV